MSQTPEHQRDPIVWHGAIALAFFALCLIRITVPGKPYFDEVHYVPAVREYLTLSNLTNIEHPPLGKELMALGMAIFGDRPLGWRIMSVLFGTLALFAASRAMWFTSLSRFASLATGWFVATGFFLFLHSRIAMLDVFMACFALLALWAIAAVVRAPETARWRLPLAGACIGLALASKWNALPILVLPALGFAVARAKEVGWKKVPGDRGLPLAGTSTDAAIMWLGVMPIVTYCLTFVPLAFFTGGEIPAGLLGLHIKMAELQQQVAAPHPYQSNWHDWVGNWRAIWYLYENVDGAQRGVLLVGNPLTMLLGLPALAWAGWVGAFRGRRDALALFVLYAATLGMWIVAAKPVQFYYHYLLPSTFLLAALALWLDEWWKVGKRRFPIAVLAVSGVLFAWFFPILTAAPLASTMSFLDYTWLASWR